MGQRAGITPDAGGMNRRMAHGIVLVLQRATHRLTRRGSFDASQSPDGVAARFRGA